MLVLPSRASALARLPPLRPRGGLPGFGLLPNAPPRAAPLAYPLTMSAVGGEGAYTYRWPRPGLTVDTIVVARGEPPKLLLIKRKYPPCQGAWALPGGFVDEGEPLDAAAARELKEETGVDPASVSLTQVGAFGDPGRDPRGWTVTVAYAAVVPSTDLGVKAADDARDAQWFPVGELPPLAFDHKLVVRQGLRHLASQPHAGAALGRDLLKAAGQLEGPWDIPKE